MIDTQATFDDETMLGQFESALQSWVTQFATTAPTYEMLRYHLGYSERTPRLGKRLRPRVVMRVAMTEAIDATDQPAVQRDALAASCALELLHNYSLVHDDIEDGDELRHGRQTVWAKYGMPQGINTGDAMCALSYLAILDPAQISTASIAARMAAHLHRANLEMCWGQGHDMAFELARHVSYAEYVTMIEGKTAALFGAACTLGAIAAGCDDERALAYGQVGRAYGRAFQIQDDILGIWGETALTGKPSGADLARRKWSFPVVWTLSHADPTASAPIAAAYAAGAPLDAKAVTTVRNALEALGAREAAAEAAENAVSQAQQISAEFALDRCGYLQQLFAANLQRRG